MNMGIKIRAKKHILSALFFVCILSGCGSAAGRLPETIPDKDRLVVYTSHKEEIYKPIIREFEERSGIWVDVVSGSTNEILSMIEEEAGNVRADIMFGGGVDSLQAYEDYFEPYITDKEELLDPTYASPSHSYTVFSKLPVVFVYNTKLVLKEDAPKTWEDLLDPAWKDEIAFTDPEKSGSAYTELSILVQELTGKGYTEKDAVNAFCINLGEGLSEGSNTIAEDVASGDKMAGIVLEESALKKISTGAELNMVYPADHIYALPDACALIKGARHKENAEKFMEFVVGDDVQHLLDEQLYRRSVRTDLPSSYIPNETYYDIAFSNEHRDELLSLWQSDMERDAADPDNSEGRREAQ